MQNNITFEITIDSQPMIVHYEPDYIANYLAHFEFHSPHHPPKQIPVSETGYRSHFAYVEELKDIPDIEEYIYQVAHAIIAQKSKMNFGSEDEEEQMSLF